MDQNHLCYHYTTGLQPIRRGKRLTLARKTKKSSREEKKNQKIRQDHFFRISFPLAVRGSEGTIWKNFGTLYAASFR